LAAHDIPRRQFRVQVLHIDLMRFVPLGVVTTSNRSSGSVSAVRSTTRADDPAVLVSVRVAWNRSLLTPAADVKIFCWSCPIRVSISTGSVASEAFSGENAFARSMIVCAVVLTGEPRG
jgi:hypothetical protein